MISQERLREVLDYNPETGLFHWKVRAGSRAMVGAVAGTITDEGYIKIKIDGRRYLAHRLVFLYESGAWPPNEVDHINQVRTDNRRHNLRLATKSENQRNAKGCGSSYKGVCYIKRLGKYQAHIYHNGRLNYLGIHETAEQAGRAYANAADKLFGEFSNHAFK